VNNLTDVKILLVDDSKTVLTILKKELNQLGIRDFSVAKDGKDAWEKLMSESKVHPFDLILCDWIMPEITGIELLKMIRQSPVESVRNMRFIMVTGSGEKVKSAMEEGADNFIAKPFTSEDLLKKLEFVLRQSLSPIS
jgi:two-component system chemotaxis response regulator CheY